MRYFVAITALLLLVGGLVFVKFSQISQLMAMGEAMQKAGPPPEAVSTAVAESQSWEGTLSAVGTVAAHQGVSLSSEVPGTVARIHFESGDLVKQGQVLVELDTRVERAELASAVVRRDLAEVTVQRSRALQAQSVVSKALLDNDESALKSAAAESSAIQAQIERKIVRAPFAGRLGIRAVNLGQYLNPGTLLTVLETSGELYVDFTLPQQELERVPVGTSVRITLEGFKNLQVDGKIAAVEPRVDDATRSLKLRAAVENPHDALRPGMFATVAVILPKRQDVVSVPRTAILHAPYGNSVFVIETKKPGSPGADTTPDGKTVKVVRQQFVRLGPARGDFIAIAEGVSPGQEIVSAGAFKLRNGAPVIVNNTVGAEPKLDPKPENR